jgi:hypothetical protein
MKTFLLPLLDTRIPRKYRFLQKRLRSCGYDEKGVDTRLHEYDVGDVDMIKNISVLDRPARIKHTGIT